MAERPREERISYGSSYATNPKEELIDTGYSSVEISPVPYYTDRPTDSAGDEMRVNLELLRKLIIDHNLEVPVVPILITAAGLPESGKTMALEDIFKRYELPITHEVSPLTRIKWHELVAFHNPLDLELHEKKVMYVSKEVDTCYLYAVYSVLAQKYHSRKQILTFDDSFPQMESLFKDESLDSSLKDLFDRLKNRDEKSLESSPIFPHPIEESSFFKHALPEGIAFINMWNIGLSRAMYYFLPFLSGHLDHNYLWLFFDLERDAGHFDQPPCYDDVRPEALRHHSDRDKLMIWRSRLYYLLRNIYYISKTTDKSRCSIFAKTTHPPNPDSTSLIDQYKKEMLELAKQMNIEQLIDGDFHLLSFGPDGTHCVDTDGNHGDLKTEIVDKIVIDGFSKKESKEFLPLSFILLRNAFYKSNELYFRKDVVVEMAAKLNITGERFEKFCNFFISGGSIIDASLLGDRAPYVINKPVSFFSELDKLFYYDEHHLVNRFGLFFTAMIKSIFGEKDTQFFLDVLIAADLAVEVSCDQIILPSDSLSNITYSCDEKFYYIPIASNASSKTTCDRTALHLQLTGPVKIRDIQVPFTKMFLKANRLAKINFTRSMHSNCTTYHLNNNVEFDLVCHGKEAEFIIRDSSGTNQTIYEAISDSCYELLSQLTSNKNVVVSVSRFNFSFLCCRNGSDGQFKFNADRHYLPYNGQTCLKVSERDKKMWNNLFKKESKWKNLPENQPITTDPLSPHYVCKLADSLQDLDDSTVTELAHSMDLKDSEVLKTYEGWRRIMVMILEYEEKAGFDKLKTFLHLQRKLNQLQHSDISSKDKRIIQKLVSQLDSNESTVLKDTLELDGFCSHETTKKINGKQQDNFESESVSSAESEECVSMKQQYKDQSMQFNYMTTVNDCLDSVHVGGEAVYLIQGRKVQSFNWSEWGLRIHFPEDSLAPSVDVVSSDPASTPPLCSEVVVKALVGGRFQFPQGSELVSAVYAISLANKLSKPVQVEIQHCAVLKSKSQFKQLTFVKAPMRQRVPLFEFSPLEGGVFSINSQWGSITLDHFSFIAIVQVVANIPVGVVWTSIGTQETAVNVPNNEKEDISSDSDIESSSINTTAKADHNVIDVSVQTDSDSTLQSPSNDVNLSLETTVNIPTSDKKDISSDSDIESSSINTTAEDHNAIDVGVQTDSDSTLQSPSNDVDLSLVNIPTSDKEDISSDSDVESSSINTTAEDHNVIDVVGDSDSTVQFPSDGVDLLYSGLLSYSRIDNRMNQWLVRFMAVKNIEALKTYLKKEYPNDIIDQSIVFRFHGGSSVLKLLIKKESLYTNGWRLYPHMYPLTIYQEQMNMFGKEAGVPSPPSCLITITVSDPSTAQDLHYEIPIGGVVCDTEIIFINRLLERESSSTTQHNQSHPLHGPAVTYTTTSEVATPTAVNYCDVFRNHYDSLVTAISSSCPLKDIARGLRSVKLVSQSNTDQALAVASDHKEQSVMTLMKEVRVFLDSAKHDPNKQKQMIIDLCRVLDHQDSPVLSYITSQMAQYL